VKNLRENPPCRRLIAFGWMLAALCWLAAGPATAAPICVVGVSKSVCTGTLTGSWAPSSCKLGGTACTTATANQLSLHANVNPGDPSCDETPDLSGQVLNAFFPTASLRLQGPDPVRGSLVGKFSILNVGGNPIANGSLEATLGVGTHRQACKGECSLPSCEKCYAATFNPSSQAWQIHTEGFLQGQFVAGPHKGCSIRWSLAGTFTAKGTQKMPDPKAPWSFCGNLDGVLECPCM
jgi:hypothetical protein